MRTTWTTAAVTWVCGVMLIACQQAIADDWPSWRGLRRDGHVTGFTVPKVWPKKLQQAWKVDVGEGHASPVVAGETVFVHSRQKDQEVVRALKLSDGKELWRQSYAAPYTMCPAAKSHGKGPKSTPVVADGRLVTLGIGGILSSWDAQSGKLLWQHDTAKRFKNTLPLYGTAMSPAVDGGLLVAHLGGQDHGALTAFDPTTGGSKWQWTDDGPGYASPIFVSVAGSWQVITQSQDHCISVSADDGELLWSIPFKTPYTQNIVTPVVVNDLVIFSGIEKGTTAYRLESGLAKSTPKSVWHNDEISMYMSSPVAVGDHLFGLDYRKKGCFFCLELATGKTAWTSAGRMGDNAALLATNEVVFALTTGAELIVFEPSSEAFKVVARYKVASSPTWAHPAIVGRQILVKDRMSLTCWTIAD